MKKLGSVVAAGTACVLIVGVSLDSGLTMESAILVGIVAGVVGAIAGATLVYLLSCVPGGAV
jgi:hypothetical protein